MVAADESYNLADETRADPHAIRAAAGGPNLAGCGGKP